MVILLMGVAGCGKTTVGKELARILSCPFFDADDFHTVANREKMKRGQALTDIDRKPWLKVLSDLIRDWEADGKNLVLACSALRKKYRTRLSRNGKIHFVFLKGTFTLICERLKNRKGHYFNPELLESQFEELEEPTDAIVVEISQDVDTIVWQLKQKYDFSRSR